MSRLEELHEDFRDLLEAFAGEGVEHVVVGAHAMAVHDVPRATGDLDVLVNPTSENAERVHRALVAFGAPLGSHGLGPDDFARRGTVYQIGLPPLRVDVLTELSGVAFDEAWAGRVTVRVGALDVPVLGREELLRNKRSSGRPKDLEDVRRLERGGAGD